MTHQTFDSPRDRAEHRLLRLRALMDRYERLREAGAALEKRRQVAAHARPPWGFGTGVLWTTAISLVMYTVLWPITRGIIAVASAAAYSLAGSSPFALLLLAIAFALPIVISALLVGVVIRARNRRRSPGWGVPGERITDRDQLEAYLDAEEERLTARTAAVKEEIRDCIGDDYPSRHLSKRAVGYCLRMLQERRADTIPDALELYERESGR